MYGGGFEVFGLLLIVLAAAVLWSTVKVVPQGFNYTVENFGRFTRTLTPGLHFLMPIVERATARVSLARKYDAVAGKAAGLGLVKKEDANLNAYVSGKALDGLYFMIGEEEKKIRRDPVATGSAILKKVFGG